MKPGVLVSWLPQLMLGCFWGLLGLIMNKSDPGHNPTCSVKALHLFFFAFSSNFVFS